MVGWRGGGVVLGALGLVWLQFIVGGSNEVGRYERGVFWESSLAASGKVSRSLDARVMQSPMHMWGLELLEARPSHRFPSVNSL